MLNYPGIHDTVHGCNTAQIAAFGFSVRWANNNDQAVSGFHRSVPAFDFTLGLWVIGSATGVAHALVFEVISQLSRYVTWTIVAEQSRLVVHMNLI